MVRSMSKAVGTTAISLKDFLGLSDDMRHSSRVYLHAPSGNTTAILLGDQSNQSFELVAGTTQELVMKNTKDLFLLAGDADDICQALVFFGT